MKLANANLFFLLRGVLSIQLNVGLMKPKCLWTTGIFHLKATKFKIFLVNTDKKKIMK